MRNKKENNRTFNTKTAKVNIFAQDYLNCLRNDIPLYTNNGTIT